MQPTNSERSTHWLKRYALNAGRGVEYLRAEIGELAFWGRDCFLVHFRASKISNFVHNMLLATSFSAIDRGK